MAHHRTKFFLEEVCLRRYPFLRQCCDAAGPVSGSEEGAGSTGSAAGEVDGPRHMPCNIQQYKTWYNTVPHKPHWHPTCNGTSVAFLSSISAFGLL